MKKIKLIISMLLFIAISLESFGAEVNNNDGSAFITKSEFDALKSSFQAQIDTYNLGIDTKIDNAIASYLSGVRISSKTTVMLPFADWKYVVGMNYKPKETYKYPGLSLTYQWLSYSTYDGTRCHENVCSYMNISKDETEQQRLMCDAGTEGSTMPTYITWNGRSKDFKDSITASLLCYNNAGGDLNKYCDSLSVGKLYYCYALRFSTGYNSDPSSNIQDIYKPTCYYSGAGAGSNRNITGYWSKSALYSMAMTDTDYNHIIHYNNVADMSFTDIDWTKTLNTLPDSTLKNDAYGYSSSSTWFATESNGSYGQNRLAGSWDGIYLGAKGVGDTTTVAVGPGLLGSKYSSDYVYQTKDTFNQVVDSDTYSQTPLTLEKGFICFAAKKGDKITWEPVFKDRKSNDSANNFEINVKLATAPFTTGNTVSSGGVILKAAGQMADYLTTTSGKVKFNNIEMPDDAIVYCKWWPTDTTIQSTNWEATLDLVNCDTYEREIAAK